MAAKTEFQFIMMQISQTKPTKTQQNSYLITQHFWLYLLQWATIDLDQAMALLTMGYGCCRFLKSTQQFYTKLLLIKCVRANKL